jgi:WD40 repeat protein
VRLVRVATGEVLPLRQTPSEWVSPVVAFSPDGGRVAAVDSGGVIVLWDVAGPWAEVKDRDPLQLQGRQLAVKGLAFSPDGKVLASGGEDGTVKVWHVATLRELYTLRARLGSCVGEVAFAPDGRCLAAACANHDRTNEVALWPASAP